MDASDDNSQTALAALQVPSTDGDPAAEREVSSYGGYVALAQLISVSGRDCVRILRELGFATANAARGIVRLTRGVERIDVPLAESLAPDALAGMLTLADVPAAEFATRLWAARMRRKPAVTGSR